MTAMDQQKDGYAVMSAVLNLIGGLRGANGEGPTNNQYYAPILSLNPSTGREFFLGGGLGGGAVGTGDENYTGIFIHEQGHAFGLPHAGDAYTGGTYPYAGGSLNGSVWGYDPCSAGKTGGAAPSPCHLVTPRSCWPAMRGQAQDQAVNCEFSQ